MRLLTHPISNRWHQSRFSLAPESTPRRDTCYRTGCRHRSLPPHPEVTGSTEAIALAVELQADWTLLDEREGRKVAKSLGLNVTGILGILPRAKQLGELESLQPVIDNLINKAGFQIAPELLAQILTQ